MNGGDIRPDRHTLLELDALLAQIESLGKEGDRVRFDSDDRYRWVLHRLMARTTTTTGTASGREGDWFVVGLASQKRHVSVYLCATVDSAYLPEANAQQLGKMSVGKSCIRFRQLADLDLDVLTELIRTAAAVGGAAEFDS